MSTCENCLKTFECDFYSYPGQKVEMLLCPDCASRLGFCISCGFFMAGNELDEHSGLPGMCYECVQDMKAELGEGDYDDDYNDAPWLDENDYFNLS